MGTPREREQALVDICFSLVMACYDHEIGPAIDNMTRDQRMGWVADQLRKCGFDTRPCGASWGVLR